MEAEGPRQAFGTSGEILLPDFGVGGPTPYNGDMLRAGFLVSLLVIVPCVSGQSGWAPPGDPLADVQTLIGAGRVKAAARLLGTLPEPSSPVERDRRDLLRAATLEGRPRAEALIALAERDPTSETAFRALIALRQHLLADDEACRHPDFQPVLGPYRRSAMDYASELRLRDDEVATLAHRAARIAEAADAARSKIPAAAGIPPLVALFLPITRSIHPTIRIPDVDALPITGSLDSGLVVRFRAETDGPILHEATLSPGDARLPIPASVPKRFVLELVDGDAVSSRTVIRSRIVATAHAFDDAVVVAVTRDGRPVEGAEVVHANRTTTTDARGLAVFTSNPLRSARTSIPVTVDGDTQLLPVERGGATSALEPRSAAHTVVDRATPAPGERIRARVTIFHADDQLSPLRPFADATLRADLRHGQTELDLGTLTTDAVGGMIVDYVVPPNASEDRLSLGLHTGRGPPIRVAIARITPLDASPEIAITAVPGRRRHLAISASRSGNVVLTCESVGLKSTRVFAIRSDAPYLLSLDDTPPSTESVRLEATLTTPDGKSATTLVDHDFRAHSTDATTPGAFTFVRGVPSFPSVDDAVAVPEGPLPSPTLRGRPSTPYLVSAVQRLDVRSALVVADVEGNATLPDFGPAAGSVRHLIIQAVVSDADAEHHVVDAADAFVRFARTTTPQGTTALTPTLIGAEGPVDGAVFSALVVEGHHDAMPFPFTDALDGEQPSCTVSTTPPTAGVRDVLDDMLHRGRPRRHALATRLGGGPRTPPTWGRVGVVDRTGVATAPPSSKVIGFTPAWRASDPRVCVELPASGPHTVFVWGVGTDGRTAFAKVKVGIPFAPPPAPSGLGELLDAHVRDVTTRLRSSDPRIVAASIATLSPVLPTSVSPDIRDALLRLVAVPPSDVLWSLPSEVGPALTAALLDPAVRANPRARDLVDTLPTFPDPRHPATDAARERLRDAPDADPDLRVRLLVNRWAADPFGTASELAALVRDSRISVAKTVLARFEEAARLRRLDAWSTVDVRGADAPDPCAAHAELIDAVDARLAAGEGAWCVVASHLLLRSPAPDTPISVRRTLATSQGRTAERIVAILRGLPYTHPSVGWWLGHMDLSAVVAALPADGQTEAVVGLLDAWFTEAGDSIPNPREVVTTLLNGARDVRPVDLRALTTLPSPARAWPERAVSAFARLASRTRSSTVRDALSAYITPTVAKTMSDDALRAWPWPAAPAARVELMRRTESWSSYPGMPAGETADADLPVYARLAHGADAAEAWESLDLPALLSIGASDGYPDFDALTRALTDNVFDAPLPDARVSDEPLVEALSRSRDRRGLRLAIARALGRRGLWNLPFPRAADDPLDDARVVIAIEAGRPDARDLFDAFVARHPERAREAAGWWPTPIPASRPATRPNPPFFPVLEEGWMWFSPDTRQSPAFAPLRALLRREASTLSANSDERDRALFETWLLHVGLGLPSS